ncbi:SsrA-binding protein SmpB [Candidatus Collierbacteria bacterium]|nr:SsrA-binding protein SmpB [Candidatus Collierbacteria bacterium]
MWQILNKKARLNYQIIETVEAGIELLGPEVKSIRSGQVSLDGAHIQIGVSHNGPEARLVGMHASPYLSAGKLQIDTTRVRRLLLHKQQILGLWDKTKGKGLTMIPIRIYEKNGWIKVEIGLVKGKKKWEKREDLKRRDIEREAERSY